MKRTADLAPAPVITIDVDAIDDALKQVEAAGGKRRAGPRAPNPRRMGAFAYFKDTEGNVLGLWETNWNGHSRESPSELGESMNPS